MGDELNLVLMPDRMCRERAKRLAPYTGVMDVNTPWTVSKNLTIPSPILSTINNWRFSDIA